MSETESVPLPKQRTASPGVATAACLVGCGLALLLILYVLSFVLILIDDRYGWRITRSMEGPEAEAFCTFYWPLIWTYAQMMS